MTEQEFINEITESQGIIHKICQMFGEDEEHKKEIFQEVLIQLWKSHACYRGDAKFSTWMYRVALNVALQDIRKTKTSKKLLIQSVELDEIADQSQSIGKNEDLVLMHQAIAKLNKAEKAIVILHLEGTPNSEIAEIIGITQNYVRVKMNRIKTKLAKIMRSI